MDETYPSQPAPNLSEGITLDTGRGRRRRKRRHTTDRTPPLHALFDQVTEGLIYFLVLFTPWAFGTTQAWSIWIANSACYALGILLLGKMIIRRTHPFQPARWGESVVVMESSGQIQAPRNRSGFWTHALAALSVLIPGYILISALNARAVYIPGTHSFDYLREPLRWLPYSYDRGATWFAFFQCVGLAFMFWAVRDWLLHRSKADMGDDDTPRWSDPQAQMVIPARLRRLLWVVSLNAACLALLSIVQRAEGTDRLLWISRTASGNRGELIFGPWAYRGSAASYFNLVWPVCVAFWLWSQERAGRALTRKLSRFDGPQLVLLPCAVFAAICPMISSSRGGAMVSAGGAVIAGLMILLVSRREVSALVRWLTTGGIALACFAALIGGWSTIRERLSTPDTRLATGTDAGTNAFSLLLRLKIPEQPDPKWQRLISLEASVRKTSLPHTLHVGIGGNGVIVAQLLGSSSTNVIRQIATNVVRQFAGQEIVLGIVRENGMRLYANGTELGTVTSTSGRAPSWADTIHTRYIFAPSSPVSEVAIVDLALSQEELAQLKDTPFDQLGDRLLATAQAIAGAPEATSNAVPNGVTVDVATRNSDPTVPWLALRRAGSEGPLGFARPLDGLDPTLRGPLRANFRVWNPGKNPVTLGVSLDGGPRGTVEVVPRDEETVSVPCQAPHGGAPRSVEIVLTDVEGEAREDVPTGTQLFLRDFHLQPGATIFTRRLTREFRILELSDRLSGRNEIYENAMAMAKDYPVWGSGAGSFSSLYQLYMGPGQDWAAYLHNDWMETRVTLGIVGLSLLMAALVILFIRSWFGSGLATMRIVPALWWLSLAGCLIHARFDFPFQVYSVIFLFLLLASVLMVITALRRH